MNFDKASIFDSFLEFASANASIHDDDKRERATKKVKDRGEEESLSQFEKEISSKIDSQLAPNVKVSFKNMATNEVGEKMQEDEIAITEELFR